MRTGRSSSASVAPVVGRGGGLGTGGGSLTEEPVTETMGSEMGSPLLLLLVAPLSQPWGR